MKEFIYLILKFIFYFNNIWLPIFLDLLLDGFYYWYFMYLEYRVLLSRTIGEEPIIFVKMVIAEIFYSFCMYGELVPFRVLFYDPFATIIFFYFFIQYLEFLDFKYKNLLIFLYY